MSVGDELVEEIAQQLELRSGTTARFYFATQPNFVVKRLLDFSPGDRKQAMERVAVFAYFLIKEKQSPEAGYALLDLLKQVAP